MTGARKLEVWIEGAPDVIPEVNSLKPHPAGYLIAEVADRKPSQMGPGVQAGVEAGGAEAEAVRCVCVVGLAHCNGLVARLSEMELDGW